MYFKKFPKITYTFDTSNSRLVVPFEMTDILRRVRIDDVVIGNTLSYDEYDILDGETPEILADKIYNNSEYHWIILIANGIIDPRFDWPLSINAFNSYVADKYGVGNEGAVHHYENADGDIVHESFTGAKTAVTNYDYEVNINESKRRIRLVKPRFVTQFVNNFYGIMING
jgi:hypothetical protein